jgi:P27 family predicted phage terminase small subunit
MAGAKQPIALVQAKGRKNLTKKEIAQRMAEEVQPCTDDIRAPSYLTIKQKTHFDKLANQLAKIKILGETDVEALARYITAEAQYETTTKDLRALMKSKPRRGDADYVQYFDAMEAWVDTQERMAKLQDRYFKQAQTAANALGLTISSRCKLIAPKSEEAPRVNKFAQFTEEAEEA